MDGGLRDASTVVLLRDGAAGLETFLMRRATTMAFAPRMHVFPGGRVDEIDTIEHVHFTTGDVEALALRGSSDARGICALYSCAVRETAEEVGIQLAHRDEEGRLLVDPTALPIIDHWVTPEMEGRRYDVRFFAAIVSDGVAELTTTEADVAAWITPASAVAEFAAGRMAMLPPTEAVLRWLAGYRSAADVIADAPSRRVVPLIPRMLAGDDGQTRWVLAHHRTGEILVDDIRMPHTRETDGQPVEGPDA